MRCYLIHESINKPIKSLKFIQLNFCYLTDFVVVMGLELPAAFGDNKKTQATQNPEFTVFLATSEGCGYTPLGSEFYFLCT